MDEEQELAMTDAIEGVASRVTHVAHEVGSVKEQGADLQKDVAEIQDERSVHSLVEEVWNVLQKTEAKDSYELDLPNTCPHEKTARESGSSRSEKRLT
jgi:predicted  nucleic acid-binding Zn-ribbon protein